MLQDATDESHLVLTLFPATINMPTSCSTVDKPLRTMNEYEPPVVRGS
jgi:hypothetical protein